MVGGLNASQGPPETVWLAFDEAWSFENSSSFKVPARVDALAAGPSLRFITTKRTVESFYAEFGEHFRPFILSGSGDFHHLTAVFTRQIKEPFAILSFDNHPDWDVRPPHWSCGAWVNRALENPLVQQVAVWGCGSFECGFPGRLLGNRSACRAGRLRVAPWRSEGKGYPSWLHPISPPDWRLSFAQFVESILAQAIYVTVDLDCLGESDAITNWENGRFALCDLVWAITPSAAKDADCRRRFMRSFFANAIRLAVSIASRTVRSSPSTRRDRDGTTAGQSARPGNDLAASGWGGGEAGGAGRRVGVGRVGGWDFPTQARRHTPARLVHQSLT